MKNTPLTSKEVKELPVGIHRTKFSNRRQRRQVLQKERFKEGLIISGTLKFKQYTQVINYLDRNEMVVKTKKINHTLPCN